MESFKAALGKKKITHVDFGYAKFKISFIGNLREGDDLCWGVSDFDAYEIRLDAGIPNEIGREVLLHEIMHGLLNFVGFGGYEDNTEGRRVESGFVPETTNEFLTDSVTKGLLLVMKLNKKLFLEVLHD